jgi:hypothetical protein
VVNLHSRSMGAIVEAVTDVGPSKGNRNINRTMRILFLSLACSAVVLTIAFYAYQRNHPGCHLCDEESYRLYAQFLLDGTPISELFLRIRTYGYPILLLPILFTTKSNAIFASAMIMLMQLFAYLLSSWFLYRVVGKRYSARSARYVLSGLLANVFVLPYLGISLTDGLSLSIEIFALSLMLIMLSDAAENPTSRLLGLGFGLGFVVGFGVMVRPSNIHWIPVCAVALIGVAAARGKAKAIPSVWIVAASVFGFCLAVFPQFLVNTMTFHRHTFLPVYDLGALQFDGGVKNLKYGTNMISVNPALLYPNPWYHDGKSSTATLGWYFQHPWNGFKTVFFHIFGALTFDTLFPYTYDLNPWYKPLLFLFNQATIFWGCVGYWDQTKRARVNGISSTEAQAAVLIGIYVTSWCAIYAFTAVESRFSLPVIAMMLPFALMSTWQRIESRKIFSAALLLFVLYLFCAGYLAHFLDRLKLAT